MPGHAGHRRGRLPNRRCAELSGLRLCFHQDQVHVLDLVVCDRLKKAMQPHLIPQQLVCCEGVGDAEVGFSWAALGRVGLSLRHRGWHKRTARYIQRRVLCSCLVCLSTQARDWSSQQISC
jgi:hypothetical protein